ncbi:S8 family serine peptidase [uncultured Tateyamaria sp.]|uniref:S8 family serine peptidase n=1 Tax=uncultured Tateyamaria sp. TaxID=455651 RepID=UPI002611A0EC|nr:S8 family serine peptidase [uncultured Tateyamaria sp.]
MQDYPDDVPGDAPVPLSQEADFRLTRLQHVFKRDEWWSALIEIEGSIDAFIANAMERGLGTRAPNLPPIPDDEVQFLVPVAYGAEERAITRDDQPVSIFARKSILDRLNVRPERGDAANRWRVQSLVLGGTIDQEMLDFDAQWPNTEPHPPVDDTATVMAVVDDGIAIAHNLFRDGAVSSRVAYAAILGARPLPQDPDSTAGRVLHKPAIDALLSDCTFDGLLDEDMFYARTGQVDFFHQVFSTVALRSSHGSHVMGLAAGQLMDASGPDRPIICAALPSRLVEDTSGVELLPSFYLSFQMLVNEARRFRTANGDLAKVVFNLSYGNSGGPHDGTGLFARLFEHYFGPGAVTTSEPQKTWLTLPAGNANLSRLHGVARAGDTETTFNLSVLPDDRTSGSVQIWMPYAGTHPSEAVIEVTSPTGETHQVFTTGTPSARFNDPAGKEIARLSYAFSSGRIQRGLAQLSISPTASIDQSEPVAPSGIWKIRILREADAENQIELWVRRDETLPGLRPGGKQAFFDNPCYERFGKYGEPLRTDPPNSDCPVTRAGTLSGFACGDSPVVVAAYTARTSELSAYSASGPCNRPSSTVGSDRDGPDLTAEGDESVFLGGVLSAGSRSGTLARRSGTSSAAPRMARAAGVAIHAFSGSGRDWAADPVSYVPGMKKLAPDTAPDPTQSGSGKYRYAVDVSRIKFR